MEMALGRYSLLRGLAPGVHVRCPFLGASSRSHGLRGIGAGCPCRAAQSQAVDVADECLPALAEGAVDLLEEGWGKRQTRVKRLKKSRGESEAFGLLHRLLFFSVMFDQ